MTTEQELAALTALITDAPTPQKPLPKSALDEMKETLESLRTINPALVDSSRIFEHLLILVDAKEIAVGTNSKIDALTETVETLKAENTQLQQSIATLQGNIRALTDSLREDHEWFSSFKKQSGDALMALKDYLMKH